MSNEATSNFALTFSTLYCLVITAEGYSNSYYGINSRSVSGFSFSRPGGGTVTINYIAVGK